MNPNEYLCMNINDKKKFWKANPVKGDISIKLPFMPCFLMHCDNDDTVVKELYWTKHQGWELTSLKLWHNLSVKVGNSIILDIGTYSGIYSLVAGIANHNSTVLSFDIQKKCIDRVNINSKINRLNNINAILSACSDKEETVTFYFYEEEGILSSIASTVPKKMNDKFNSVKSINLDNYFRSSQSNTLVKLIKIDVEDAEVSTINGLKETIKNFSPDILIEINDPHNVKKVTSLILSNYKIYSIDEVNPRIKEVGFFFKRFDKSRNFLLTTKHKDEVNKLLL